MTEDNTARLSAPEAIRYATMIVRDVLSSTTEEEDIANVREESLVNLSALLEAHIGERASTAFVEPPGSSAAGDLLQVLATLQTLFVEGNDDANEALANTSVLQHIGWDLYKQLVPLVAMGGEVATHSIALLERVMAVCSPKEMFIVLAEQLEAWDGSLPNASYVAQVLLTHFAKAIQGVRPARWTQFLATAHSALSAMLSEVEIGLAGEWTPEANKRLAFKAQLRRYRLVSKKKGTREQSVQFKTGTMKDEDASRILQAITLFLQATVTSVLNDADVSTGGVLDITLPTPLPAQEPSYWIAAMVFEVFGSIALHLSLSESTFVAQSSFAGRVHKKPDGTAIEHWSDPQVVASLTQLKDLLTVSLHLEPVTALHFAAASTMVDTALDRQPQAPKVEDALDYGGEDDDGKVKLPPIPLAGVACWLGLVIKLPEWMMRPLVLNPQWSLTAVLPVVALLLESGKVPSMRGLLIFEDALLRAPAKCLAFQKQQTFAVTSAAAVVAEEAAKSPVLSMVESIVSFMTSCPDPAVRGVCSDLLALFVAKVDDRGVLDLFADLIPRCPFPNGEAMLIDVFKAALSQRWKGSEKSILRSRAMWPDLLGYVFRFHAGRPIGGDVADSPVLLEKHPVLMASLNLLYTLLLCDTDNETGVLDADYQQFLQREFLKPLDKEIDVLKRDLDRAFAQNRLQPDAVPDAFLKEQGASLWMLEHVLLQISEIVKKRMPQ